MLKTFLMLGVLLVLAACSATPKTTLVNPGFETGDLSGWEVEGDAFSDALITSKLTYGPHDRFFHHEGSYHLYGASNPSKTGTLTSETFTLVNTGFLSFLIGGGANYTRAYVALYDAETDEELSRRHNTMFDDPTHTDGYVRVIWDASAYIGQKVYIKIVDNDTSDYYAYLNVDDFQINLTEEELAHYQTDALVRLGHSPEGYELEAINRYISMNAWKIDENLKMNYHVTGQIGWINDPNGFVHFDGRHHLFYQHNPKDVVWGPMHWGHVVSDDFVKWEYLPIALAPDQHYDREGAFSGSALDIDGTLYLFYTGNIPNRQVQAIATSKDGITFDKYDGNPVIDESTLPAHASAIDFRDPKVWEKDGTYYMVVGSRQVENNYGQILMFRSEDLRNWNYHGTLYQGSSQTFDKLGYMWECPDVFKLGDRYVLIMSPQQVPGHRNYNSTVYVVGDLNYETGVLENIEYHTIDEIDYGFDFYAPQTMLDDQGRRILVSWMQSWNREPVTAHLGFSGFMTLPRVLELEDGKLVQRPVPEIENYRQNKVTSQFTITDRTRRIDGIEGDSKELLVTLIPGEERSGVRLFKGQDEETLVYYEDGHVVFDRTNGTNGRINSEPVNNITKVPVPLVDGAVELRIFLDKYSVEVFINNGERVMSSTVFPSEDAIGIEFFTEGTASFIVESYDIIVD